MIFRVMKNPENPYVMINKTALNDDNLTWKAKGLLCYMLCMPDDWQFYETELVKHSKDGRDSFRSAIKELIVCGYIHKGKRIRNEKGFLKGNEYTVYESSIHSGKSNVGLSNVGKTTTSNKELELYNDNTNILPPKDGVAEKEYIYFKDIEDHKYIKIINNKISANRKKISVDNYNNVRKQIKDIFEIVEEPGLYKMIEWYILHKSDNRSVENFILYKDRFYREYDYEMEG